MNKDDIIRMAREVGFDVREGYVAYCYIDALKTFAERIAAAAKAGEREACGKLLDEMSAQDKWSNYYKVAARAIRARGNT